MLITGVVRVIALSVLSAAAFAQSPVTFSCSGPAVESARKIAKANELKLALDPKACFGQMKLTESARRQIVVAVPSTTCKTGKLLNVYDRSRAGPYHALFEQPPCGTNISVGPKSPYGDNMITIDGRKYLDKAGSFVPFK
jgi:hypothetical protein